ncbi:MAG TPA: cytochrome c3 family protein [Gemmatimonadaceae bacterium]|nr:cytochrome c3 family protein [Gemmatimonadaceae bacterium]
MSALFPRWSNLAFRTVLLVGAIGAVAVPFFLMGWVRTPAVTQQYHRPAQPVPFNHVIHVHGLGIDCRYCHSTVERAATAGIPATSVCVPCHNQTWMQSPAFAAVRRSLSTDMPIPWQRVNRLPDFVYFNHAIHVNKGVGCETCHGRVDRMTQVDQAAPLTMGWCLDCHRHPERYLRPVAQMTTMGWTPERPQREVGEELMERYKVRHLTNCTTCHR